jgi:hypothetical protein
MRWLFVPMVIISVGFIVVGLLLRGGGKRRARPDTVLVSLTMVGPRVEIDVFEDGHMEVSA